MPKDVTNIPRETTMVRIADTLERMVINPGSTLDGTVDTYKAVMREWFLASGARNATPEKLTEICNDWYALTRPSWRGGVQFYQTSISSVSTGTATGDNVGMVCEPSTDTVAGQDDYAGNPLFACVDVNWELDENGDYLITEIDGITDGFRRKDPSKFVGVMQMTPWIYEIEGEETYEIGVSGMQSVTYDVFPAEEAVRTDGTVSEFVLHGKYAARITDDGAMTCCSGVKVTPFQSQNSGLNASAKTGAKYSGMSCCDVSWLQLMAAIMQKSLTMDGIIQGCVSNNVQSPAAVSETGVKRILVTSGTTILPGMNVVLGNYGSNLDRGYSAMYSITGNIGVTVTDVESVSVDGTAYDAIYVDTDYTFDTAANGAQVSGTTYISTWHWPTGTTDVVLGNNGSPTSCTSGRYAGKIQGIEYSIGGYEILNDVIVTGYADDEGVLVSEPYVVCERDQQSTELTSDYKATGLVVEQIASSASNTYSYIKRLRHARGLGMTSAVETGGSSSTYVRDVIYPGQQVTSERQYCVFGSLATGVGVGGLSCEDASRALSHSTWTRIHRLSPNGCRGEWAS